ncbi:MAG: hypothetical protein H6978_12105 [Gammaproteobacteria bacterium]|nr:hypothetical protein [Gammaproteobacteria bacterium]
MISAGRLVRIGQVLRANEGQTGSGAEQAGRPELLRLAGDIHSGEQRTGGATPGSDASHWCASDSSCLTGDVFGSQRCECGPQHSRARTDRRRSGGRHAPVSIWPDEGRGIGLWAKGCDNICCRTPVRTPPEANRTGSAGRFGVIFADAAALLHYFTGDRQFPIC